MYLLRSLSGKTVFSAVLLCQLFSCSAPQTTPTASVADTPCETLSKVANKTVIGEVEYVLVGDGNLLQKARIDTGAATTSIGYDAMTPFERDGKPWVAFTLRDRFNNDEHEFKQPRVGTVNIKRAGADAEERPVVKMRLTLGDIAQDVEVTLANRDEFDYPVLIGRNFLEGKAMVDVSRRFLASSGGEE
ncbi:hypothetical protein P886_0979 [Alteromonadaceae bacterium 2753L.S.0a.02]|nr:hypothetical protein P886_0979 [Alteromonadaceae bacterium 2753L.S.0a.02]